MGGANMRCGKFAVAAGSLLTVGFFLDAAVADATGAEAVPETTIVAEAAPATGTLTGDDIRTHVVGNTTTRFLRGGWWMEYYAPDGRIAGRWRNLPFEGTWAVR